MALTLRFDDSKPQHADMLNAFVQEDFGDRQEDCAAPRGSKAEKPNGTKFGRISCYGALEAALAQA